MARMLEPVQNIQKLDSGAIISVRFFLTKCTFYKNKGGENRSAQVAAHVFFLHPPSDLCDTPYIVPQLLLWFTYTDNVSGVLNGAWNQQVLQHVGVKCKIIWEYIYSWNNV